jgi:hypothetical protein
MKKYFTLFGLLLYVVGYTQTTTIAYAASADAIANPERGFYRHTSAHAGVYTPLDQALITTYRVSNNITLLSRNFRLNDFINSPISDAYLANMQSDFDKIRNAGLKCIIRFTYSDDDTAPQMDATKATILSHILQLKPYLEANADVIAAMQAGFIGAWGEWYSTSQADFGGWGYDQTNLTATNINNRKEVLNAILAALPSNRMVQVRYPAFKQDAYSMNGLNSSQAYTGTNQARIGHHNDCFLATATDYGTYENIAVEYPFLEQDTKFVPMGGETCQLNSPRTDCTTALYEMAKFHWSFLNIDYYPDVIDGFRSSNCFSDIQNKLGYRFVLNEATLPQAISLGSTLPVTIKIVNQGYASLYNERKVYLVLKNLTTNQVFPILMNTDPRSWVGPNEITITENLTLPSNLTTGNYKLYLSLPDSAPSIANKPEYAVRLANLNLWESKTGYNSLNFTLNVTNSALGITDNSRLNVALYPVPSKNELTVELENIKDYTVEVFNSLGQKVSISNSVSELNKMIVNTESLSDGLYFIEFTKDTIKDARKFIVRH